MKNKIQFPLICNKTRCLISVRSSIAYVISHNYAKIKVDSYVQALEKTMTFDNVIMLIKSAVNKYKSNCNYNIFLEKTLYELPKKVFA